MSIHDRVNAALQTAKIEAEANGVEFIATVATTRKAASQDFYELPLRHAPGVLSVNFLVSTREAAKECFSALDGRVRTILVDVERKTSLELATLGHLHVHHSTVRPFKPNDATVAAAHLFLTHYLGDNIHGKSVAILGAGNIGAKMALMCAEQGAEVFVTRRTFSQAQALADGLNLMLSPYSEGRVFPTLNEILPRELDAVCCCAPDIKLLTPQVIEHVRKGGLALDVAIGSFAPDAITAAYSRGVTPLRVDVRPGFPVSLNHITEFTASFFSEIVGRRETLGYAFVSGGVIGQFGDVIVDQVENPRRVIGLADGTGGVLSEADLGPELVERMRSVREFIHSGVR